jgi:alkanesulfonate monooxygenase SsuD/methylene tetrahydromethanopterin reductase-like flavin-dependent oxidoreductase (luciferase family)
MTHRQFRFGIVAAQVRDLESWTALARRTEELGYDTLLATDPLNGSEPLDPLTALSAAAAVTSRLNLGTYVLADPLRDRRMLAWQVDTLHALSGGRFELGLGVGRPDSRKRALAMAGEFGSAGQRLERLAETVSYLKQRPERPRLLLAGAGPKMLRFAAREADTLTMAWQPRTTEAAAKSIVDEFRTVAGPRLDEIELAANLVAVGEEPVPWLKMFTGADLPELIAGGAVTVLPGTADDGEDTLRRWREQLGISYITINSAFLERFAPIVERLSGA